MWQEGGGDQLQEIEEIATKWALVEERKFDQAKRKAFEERLEKAAQGGAAKLHKWTKLVAVWTSLVRQDVGKGLVKRCGPMAEDAEALQEWAIIWKVGQEVQREEIPLGK